MLSSSNGYSVSLLQMMLYLWDIVENARTILKTFFIHYLYYESGINIWVKLYSFPKNCFMGISIRFLVLLKGPCPDYSTKVNLFNQLQVKWCWIVLVGSWLISFNQIKTCFVLDFCRRLFFTFSTSRIFSLLFFYW